MKKITKLMRNGDFLTGLIVGIVLGMVLCPLRKGLAINSYNEGNKNCQNAVHNQKKKAKKEKE